MGRWFIALPLLALVCLYDSSVRVFAEDVVLTPEQQAWLVDVNSAGWRGTGYFGDVIIQPRDAPIFDEHLRPVLAAARQPDGPDVSGLNRILRISVAVDGWLGFHAVTEGTYYVGIRQGRHDVELHITDTEGRLIGVDGMSFTGSTGARPGVGGVAEGGGARSTVEAKWGGISASWQFVSRAAHDNAAGELESYRAGQIHILSDLPENAGLQELAEQCKAAVAANAELGGVELPDDVELRLYILQDLDRHSRVNRLVTDGQHEYQLGYTSHRTRYSYLRYHLQNDASAFESGLPRGVLEAAIHELHHQYMLHVYPTSRVAPLWLQEGLAEIATERGLALLSEDYAADFVRGMRTSLAHAAWGGLLPADEDLLRWRHSEVRPLYVSAWAVVREIDAEDGRLPDFVATVYEHTVHRSAKLAARRELDGMLDSITDVLTQQAEAVSGTFHSMYGLKDREGDALRVTSVQGRAALSVVPQPVRGPRVTMQGEYRWHPEIGRQLDFVLAVAEGREVLNMLKVAWMPDRVVLLRLEDGEWTNLTSFDFDTPLERGTADEPLWHEFTLTFQSDERTLRFETTGGRWVQFQVHEYVSVRNTIWGVGCFDGIAWFRNLQVSE
jgi:hypothetical protein